MHQFAVRALSARSTASTHFGTVERCTLLTFIPAVARFYSLQLHRKSRNFLRKVSRGSHAILEMLAT